MKAFQKKRKYKAIEDDDFNTAPENEYMFMKQYQENRVPLLSQFMLDFEDTGSVSACDSIVSR